MEHVVVAVWEDDNGRKFLDDDSGFDFQGIVFTTLAQSKIS